VEDEQDYYKNQALFSPAAERKKLFYARGSKPDKTAWKL
jgi:hypothetical protein